MSARQHASPIGSAARMMQNMLVLDALKGDLSPALFKALTQNMRGSNALNGGPSAALLKAPTQNMRGSNALNGDPSAALLKAPTQNMRGSNAQTGGPSAAPLKAPTSLNGKIALSVVVLSSLCVVAYQWNSSPLQNAEQIIEQYIESPGHLDRSVGEEVQQELKSYIESENLELLEELKQEYKRKLQIEELFSNVPQTLEIEDQENHQTNLVKLMKKTDNLFANVVQENGPMDMTWDNNLVSSESSTVEKTKSSVSKNNCLYPTVASNMPDPDEPRAPGDDNSIEPDKEICNEIKQRWDQLSKPRRANGGQKQRIISKKVSDDESSSFNEDIHGSLEDFSTRIREPPGHLADRFTRLVRFAGIIQRISEITGVCVEDVVGSGASRYQDQSSKRGKEVHAAHVIRGGEINPKIKDKFPLLYNELKNVLGHTQNVPRFANSWGGIGGAIDRFQTIFLDILNRINFNGSLNAEAKNLLQIALFCFKDEFDSYINGEKLSDSEKSELIDAKRYLDDFSIEELFQKGKDGYLGKGMDKYNR